MNEILIKGVKHIVLEVTEHYEKMYNTATKEIVHRDVIDLKGKLVKSAEENEKRKSHYKKEEIKKKREENKPLRDLYAPLGNYYNVMLGTKKPRTNDEIHSMEKILTITEEGYLTYILGMFFESTKKPLMIRGNLKDDKIILRNKDLESALKLSKGRISKLLKKYKSVNILYAKKDEKGLFVNPKFFQMFADSKGEYVIGFYQKKLKEVINNLVTLFKGFNDDVIECLGLLKRLSHAVHYKTFHICANPDDNIIEEHGETVTDALMNRPDSIMYFGTRELLRFISDGEKEAKIQTAEFRLFSLIIAGGIQKHSGSGTTYYMNPELVNRQFSEGALNCEHRKHVIKEFIISAAAAKQQLASFRQLERKRVVRIKKRQAAKVKEINPMEESP